jgi:hypothetical protein
MKNTTNIGAKAKTHRNATTSPLRFRLEAALAKLPRSETLSCADLAEQCNATEKTVAVRLRQMAHEGLAANINRISLKAQWRLTMEGRRRFIPGDPPEADPAETEAAEEPYSPPNVASSRTWHSGSQPTAPIGSLSPWASGCVRAGALVARDLPSRGIKA